MGSAGTPQYLPGIKVPEVVRGGAADRAGVRDGDLINAVNGAPVLAEHGEVDRLVKLIRRSDGKAITIDILRAGQPQQVTKA